MHIAKELSGAATGVPLRFTVPREFHEINLDEDQQQRVQRTVGTLTTNFRGLKPTEALAMVYAQEMMLRGLVEQGAVYVAQCVARSEVDATRLCVGQFFILVQKADLHGPRPLATIASGLRTPGDPREIAFVNYPAGEGLAIGEELVVQPSATVTGQSSSRTHRLRQAQIVLASPDRRRLAILGVSSESIDDWPHLAQILDNIAHSVSFSAEAENLIASRLNTLD
jgi:hypothetical protein